MTAPAVTGTPRRDRANFRVIDTDLHHRIADWRAVSPFVPDGLRHRVARSGGPPMARHAYQPLGVSDPDAVAAAADPARTKERYLDPCGIDLAILTGTLTNLSVQPNVDIAAGLARGVNDWTLETWVRPFDCYKGSILVAPQDPVQAVAEIDRLGSDPGMVQVLIGSAAEAPLGRRVYHPIYDACVRHDLPLALHIGGEGAGMSPAATAVGHPSTAFEWYGSLPQSYMAHLMSMVTEGVFERFPSLNVILYEGGIFWLPHVMWRFDKNWKAQRAETPWVKERPSAYILRHVYSTTYPLESLPDPAALGHVLEMVDAHRTLLFAGNFPDWDYGDPFAMLDDIPDSLRRPILVDSALAVYGERLLAPNR